MAARKNEPWSEVVRLSHREHRERLARVEEAMSARLAGARVPRVAVLAAVVEKGLEAVERELGLTKRR